MAKERVEICAEAELGLDAQSSWVLQGREQTVLVVVAMDRGAADSLPRGARPDPTGWTGAGTLLNSGNLMNCEASWSRTKRSVAVGSIKRLRHGPERNPSASVC